MRQVEKQTTTYLRGAHLQLTYVVCCHLPTSFPATYLRLLRAPPPPHTHRYGAQWHINRHRQTETIRPTKKNSLHTYCADMVDLTHVLCCVHLHTCCAAYTCTHAALHACMVNTRAYYSRQRHATCYSKEALPPRQLTANTGRAQTASTANTHHTASKEKQSYRHSLDCHSTPSPTPKK
jgi:hypothetical protein